MRLKVAAIVVIALAAALAPSAASAQEGNSFVAKHSGKCLDVAGASKDDGASVIQWGCHGGPNQQWYFDNIPGTSWGFIRVTHSRKCLSVVAGRNVIQSTCENHNEQLWQIIGQGGDYEEIRD